MSVLFAKRKTERASLHKESRIRSPGRMRRKLGSFPLSSSRVMMRWDHEDVPPHCRVGESSSLGCGWVMEWNTHEWWAHKSLSRNERHHGGNLMRDHRHDWRYLVWLSRDQGHDGRELMGHHHRPRSTGDRPGVCSYHSRLSTAVDWCIKRGWCDKGDLRGLGGCCGGSTFVPS